MSKKQFAYQDKSGFIYPDHHTLRLQPGLVPGFYYLDTKKFVPVGNPMKQTGTIVSEQKGSQTVVMSGLEEDTGADVKPKNSVQVPESYQSEDKSEEAKSDKQEDDKKEPEKEESDQAPKRRGRPPKSE